jgi:Alginate lyase
VQHINLSKFIISALFALCLNCQVQAADQACPTIAAPDKVLATPSKYDQTDSSRSTISDNDFKRREHVLRPVRHSIAQLAELKMGDLETPQAKRMNGSCVIENLVRWAQTGALTQMETSDAYLARDRFVSEVLLTFVTATEIQPLNAREHKIIAPWLITIADSTMAFYNHRAGETSRMNNHRYWAGLAVGTVGIFLENAEYEDWGMHSYKLGVCQVDEAGYLPLELSRGSRALEYHVYSLRPLQALAKLAEKRGKNLESQCNNGLTRLRNQTLAALKNSGAISQRAGLAQTGGISEASFSIPLQL